MYLSRLLLQKMPITSIPRTDKQTIYDFIIKEMYGSAEDSNLLKIWNYLPGRVSIGCLGNIGAYICSGPVNLNAHKEVGFHNNTTSAEITEYFKKQLLCTVSQE